MLRRAKKEDDYLGPSRGWFGIFHRVMMVLLFPLRKPLWFLLIILVLFLAPTFRGVKPAEVHTWYWSQIKDLGSVAKTQLSNKAQEVIPEVSHKVEQAVQKIAAQTEAVVNVPVEQEPQIIPQPQPQRETRRKMFERAQVTAAVVTPPVTIEPAVEKQVVKAAPAPLPAKLNLKYLQTPEEIFGLPQVINANELKVANRRLFLYGIFVSPTSENGVSAVAYLRNLLADKTVICRINAYTYQEVPTAICDVDGININRRLVEQGYSKNVALD